VTICPNQIPGQIAPRLLSCCLVLLRSRPLVFTPIPIINLKTSGVAEVESRTIELSILPHTPHPILHTPMNWQNLTPNPLKKLNLKSRLIAGGLGFALAVGIPLVSHQSLARTRAAGDYEQRLFDAALAFTLYFEGGFSNHPADIGGRTYRGILQTEYNAYRARRGLPPLDVVQMSEAEMLEIYDGYWDGSGAAAMHPALAIVMFDTAVNFGINNSITFLQQALGLPQTGVFDATTRAALQRGNNKYTALQIVNERILYRYKRVQENSSQMAFFHGWLSRDYSLWGYVNQIQN